jgi:transglutaminase-like putative cysteine protease
MNLIFNKTSILLLGLSVGVFAAFAQPSKPFSYYAQKCPACDAVVLNAKRTYTIKEGKNGLTIKTEDMVEMMILGNNIAPFVEDDVSYSSLVPLLKIEAYSLIPDVVPEGKSYKKYPVSKFTDKHADDNSIFYHDAKEKVFLYPNLTQGAITCYKTQHELKEPRFFGTFFFGNFTAVENAELSVVCPNNVQFNYRLYGYDTANIKLTVTQKGNTKIYHWQMNDVPKYYRSSRHVGARYFLPHIELYLESHKPANKPVQYFFPDIKHLFSWYVDIVKPSEMQSDSSMRTLTDSLLAPLSSDIDKVKAVYYWVQDNIKYIAFEEAYEGYIPRKPSDVFRWRYGDCKDMAFLLYTLLKPYNLHVAPAWVGTRSLPYKYTELPCISTDNHAINVFEDNDGKLYFLDPTSTGLNLNFPSDFIQGKQCLSYQSDEKYRVLEIPVLSPHDNIEDVQFRLTFSGDTLLGKGTYFANGYPAQEIVAVVQRAGTKKKEVYEYLFSVGNNKFKLDTIYTASLSRDSGFRAEYAFTIPNYISSTKDEIYINLNLEKDLANARIEPKHTAIPLELDYLTENVYTSVFEIPSGYKLEHLPENKEFDNDIFSAGFIYELKGNTVHFKKYLIQKKLIVPTQLFELYNETVDNVCKMYKQCIVLKKK